MRRCSLLSLLLAVCNTPAVAGCGSNVLTELPLRNAAGFLVVTAALGGEPISLLLDTGADAGFVTAAAARRFALPPDPSRTTQLEGTGGNGGLAPHVGIVGLTLGAVVLPPHSVPVGPLPAMPRIEPPVVGLLGADILANFDVEIDVPHGRLVLRQQPDADCATPLAWAPGRAVPLRRRGDRLVAQIKLDGHPLDALIDTGALSVVLDRQIAVEYLGVSEAALARDPGGLASGIDMREQSYHWHRFATLEVGPVLTRGPVLTVMPVVEQTPLLLGASWFALRPIILAYSTAQMFVAR